MRRTETGLLVLRLALSARLALLSRFGQLSCVRPQLLAGALSSQRLLQLALSWQLLWALF